MFGIIRGECMCEFHPSLSSITKDLSLSLSLARLLLRWLKFDRANGAPLPLAGAYSLSSKSGLVFMPSLSEDASEAKKPAPPRKKAMKALKNKTNLKKKKKWYPRSWFITPNPSWWLPLIPGSRLDGLRSKRYRLTPTMVPRRITQDFDAAAVDCGATTTATQSSLFDRLFDA